MVDMVDIFLHVVMYYMNGNIMGICQHMLTNMIQTGGNVTHKTMFQGYAHGNWAPYIDPTYIVQGGAPIVMFVGL